jgi:hypothetical protein
MYIYAYNLHIHMQKVFFVNNSQEYIREDCLKLCLWRYEWYEVVMLECRNKHYLCRNCTYL